VRLRGPTPTAVLSREILIVLGLSLGMSAINSVVSLVVKLTATRALNQQTTSLNVPLSTRPFFDVLFQLLDIVFAVMPALLAIYLLNRSSPRPALGLDLRRWRSDVLWSIVLAGVIGVPGLLLYLGARELGLNTIVAAANLSGWWSGPVLVLSAAANGVLEEIVVVGYLLTRLRDVGWGVAAAITFSAVLRGTYHLYQGFGAFLGNAIMGVVFAVFFLRTRRLWPLVLAHTLLDVVAFLGYTLLRDHVSWL